MTEPDQHGIAPAAIADVPMFNRAAWARMLPFLAYILFIVAEDLLGRFGFSPAALRVVYPIKIGVVLALLLAFRRHYTELSPLRLSPRVAAAAVAAGVLVLLLWISLNAGWMVIGSAPGFDPRDGGRLDWPLVAVRIAGAALVVPVMEELFWRSFLMRWIDAADFESVDPARVSPKAFVITAVLFGFEHNLWLAGIVAGVAYCSLYMRHRTVWSPILAHAVTNGLLGVWVVSTGSWSYW